MRESDRQEDRVSGVNSCEQYLVIIIKMSFIASERMDMTFESQDGSKIVLIDINNRHF